MTRIIGCAILMMGIASTAGAKDHGPFEFPGPVFKPSPEHERTNCPEIDPNSSIAALTLLAGGVAVLRGRRSTSS